MTLYCFSCGKTIDKDKDHYFISYYVKKDSRSIDLDDGRIICVSCSESKLLPIPGDIFL